MRILFISRGDPPVIGGMEKQNLELSRHLAEISETKIVANRHGKIFLPLFLPYALAKAVFLMRKFDILILGDGVLAVIGYIVKLFYSRKKKIVCVLHGLDITYRFWLYRALWVKKFIPVLDKLIAVGNETIRQGVKRGIPEEKFVFIPNGVNPDQHVGNYSKADLEKIIGENLEGGKTILTSGRLAKRKGVAWFLGNVMPRLPENVIFIIFGEGPEKKNILQATKKNHLKRRVKFLGYQPDEIRDTLFNTCDLFVQPNIKIQGDIEGFGISVIEATTCRLPVVASNLEGLKDAIKANENGFLVESGNASAWVAKINELLSDDQFRKDFGEKARKYAIENYSWDKIAKKYIEVIESIHL